MKPRIQTATGHCKKVRLVNVFIYLLTRTSTYHTVVQRLNDRVFIIRDISPFFCRYVGRPAAAAVATGNKKIHNNEQETLLNDALRI